MLKNVYGGNTLTHTSRFEWFKSFKKMLQKGVCRFFQMQIWSQKFVQLWQKIAK